MGTRLETASADDSQPRTQRKVMCRYGNDSLLGATVRCLKSGNWTLPNAMQRALIGLSDKLVFAHVRRSMARTRSQGGCMVHNISLSHGMPALEKDFRCLTGRVQHAKEETTLYSI
jgi:hypothetical protein